MITTTQIREKLIETAKGYKLPEGILDVVDVVADSLEVPRSRVERVAWNTDFKY